MQKKHLKSNFILIQLLFLIGLLTFVTLASLSVNAENEGNLEVNIASTYDPLYGPIETGNGTPILAREGIQLHLRTQSNFQINATFGEDVEVSVNETVDCPLGDCPQIQNHNRLTYMWQIETNNSGVSLNARFGYQYDPDNLPEGCTPERLKFAFYNGSLNQWQFVYTWVNQSKNMVYADTNHFSLWTIFAEPDQQGPINTGNGTPILAREGIQLHLRTQSNFQVNATFGEDVEVSINETVDCPLGDCPQVQNHNRLTYMWQIETNNSDVSLNARFGYQYDPENLPEGCTPEGLKFAFYNGSLNQWQFVYTWINQSQNMVYANTDHFSLWTIFAEPTPQGPQIPNKNEVNNIQANGTPIKMEAGNTYRFQVENGFQLNVSFDKNVEMNITEKTKTQLKTQAQTMAKEMIGTGMYMEIETNDTGVKIQATLMFQFTKSELNVSIDPLKLQFAYFNGELNQWEKIPSWVEEIEPNKFMVYANTTHFSTWTVIGEETAEETSIIGFELLTLIPMIAILAYRKKK